MENISTKKLFESYFLELHVKDRRISGSIDRPEIYDYEKRIKKNLIQMSPAEIFDMIMTFDSGKINISTFQNIVTKYRNLFNYYIVHYEQIDNPMDADIFHGKSMINKFYSYDNDFLDMEKLKNIIDRIYKSYDYSRALYYECVIQLYFNGFMRAAEIVTLKKDMIDFEKNIIHLDRADIHISKRCANLLKSVNSMLTMPGTLMDYECVSYRGGYFKFPVRKKSVSTFDDREVEKLAGTINSSLAVVSKEIGRKIKYRDILLLGLYNSMVGKIGKSHTDEIILSDNGLAETRELTKLIEEYGLIVNNITYIKRELRKFTA